LKILFHRTDSDSISTDQEEPAMEYLITMTTHIPGDPATAVS